MKRFGDLPLPHQPGEQWHYNSGSDILGVLISRVTGMSLGDFLQERIFAQLDRLATCYWTNFETGESEVFDEVYDSRWARPPVFESGAAGLVSTVDDLLAFGRMMLDEGKYGNERVLSRPSVELMATDQLTPEQKAAPDFFPGLWEPPHPPAVGRASGPRPTRRSTTETPQSSTSGWPCTDRRPDEKRGA